MTEGKKAMVRSQELPASTYNGYLLLLLGLVLLGWTVWSFLAFAQRPEQHGNRADIERVRGEPEQVRCDAVQFGKNSAQVMCSRRNREAHHLFDCLNPDEAIGNRGDVIKTIPVRSDHRVHAILGNLFHAAMQVTDVAVEIYNCFAVESQDDAQHTVR